MMLKFLLFLPALVNATRFCTYTDLSCTSGERCFGCIEVPSEFENATHKSLEYELSTDEKKVRGIHFSEKGCTLFSRQDGMSPLGDNGVEGKCHAATDNDMTELTALHFKYFNYVYLSMKFGNANNVGISFILVGLLLSFYLY
eukprot:GHVR01137660.1.p1 GENE.GHVR01137660.1~~GHVR01137660.1.p1  ORF type:complete len:143 (+),score=11.53 GHVR01137660.1:81-509(+)